MTKEEQKKIIILSGPSGTGKSTITKQLLKKNTKQLKFSISTTTRERRPQEKEGVHYFFVTREVFREKFRNDEFLEIAEVHGNYYGTDKKTIKNIISQGFLCLLDIDVQGAISMAEIYPHAKRIFLLPPSLEELRIRLSNRGDTHAKEVEIRLRNALKELAFIAHYEYFIVNTTPRHAIQQLEKFMYGATK